MSWPDTKIAEARRLRAEGKTWKRIAELFCCAESTLFEVMAQDARTKRRETRQLIERLRVAAETERTGIPPYRAKHHRLA